MALLRRSDLACEEAGSVLSRAGNADPHEIRLVHLPEGCFGVFKER